MMSDNIHSHRKAVLQALLVTFLWSTSWVLIKIGLADIPSLTFAGLRYSLAFLCLLFFFVRQRKFTELSTLNKFGWARLVFLGCIFYTITQGSQFLGLSYLPAVTVNLILSLTSIVVALMSILFLSEYPKPIQWLGIGVSVLGALVFFYPAAIQSGLWIGWAAVIAGMVANAGSSILGRSVNRSGDLSPLTITAVTMGIGGLLLLGIGITLQGLPILSLANWLIVIWLAVVNTAFAFNLWNLTLKTLAAPESSVINNSMMIQIPILAVVFLGESLSLQQVTGLITAAAGILLVQLGKGRKHLGKPVKNL